MIVCNLYDLNTLYFQPDIFSRGISRYGILVRFEYQPIRLVKIARPLTFSVSLQLVKIAGHIPYILKSQRISQSTQSHQQQLSPYRTKCSCELGFIA